MKNTVYTSIWLDTRRAKKNGKYPVKLRIQNAEGTMNKMYGTKYDFIEKDFEKTMNSQSSKFKNERLALQALEKRANDIIEKLPDFDLTDFERLMYNKTSNKNLNVNFYFQKVIDEKKQKNRISTALGYQNALDCLLRFHNNKNIDFNDVTVSFLEQFEKFCTETENKTIATTGIYLRNLRTVFNLAIEKKTVSADSYPFGRHKYQIKTAGKVKKALNKEQLKTLFEGEPATPQQAKAKAFWFFSYLCNGMNFHDILKLKCKDYDNEKITFIRTKTEKNTKQPEPITVFVPDYAKQVLNDYGNPTSNPNDFIFDVFDSADSADEKRRKKQNFIRFTNQHFLKYAKSLGIDEKISTYWARHSFSTMLLRQNEPVAVISEALGHTDLKTTMSYLDGFDEEVKKEIPNKLLNF